MAGEPPDRLFQAEDAPFAHPVLQQMGREAGVAELAGMGARIGEPEHAAVVAQQVGQLDLVVVEQHDAEPRPQVLLEGIGKECCQRVPGIVDFAPALFPD